jgi:hydroxymethylpyrimidine kinase/phosphomethylpyrimidine kinase
MKPICLTIAGSDPSGGAGIQADIRTFDRLGVHPFSVITAITYQSATEFYGYKSLSDQLQSQLQSLFESYPIKVIKVGMIPDIESISIIFDYIDRFDLEVVLDPVSVSSTGKRLSTEGLEMDIEQNLFPLVKVLTPNNIEATLYSGIEVSNLISLTQLELAKNAAEKILSKMFIHKPDEDLKKAVIIKSVINTNLKVLDLACIGQFKNGKLNLDYYPYEKDRNNLAGNIHGTGCVFSSSIAAFLSKGEILNKAIDLAEDFFASRFANKFDFPNNGKILDLSRTTEELDLINQIKEIYNFISSSGTYSELIPEVRMNISGALSYAKTKEDVAGIEGRITIMDGFPHAAGDVKFGVSDHTARLILTARQFDESIKFVMNLRYKEDWINKLIVDSNLLLREIHREEEPKESGEKEDLTMQWLIKDSIDKIGKIPDIIWDRGALGKEPMIRLFGKSSKDMIIKLKKVVGLIFN